jgi:hypothetical protein
MGSGSSWSASTYSTRVTNLKDTGTDYFGYSATTISTTPRSSWKVHEDLDPSRLNKAGINIREAFDSDAHQNVTPIAIMFDVTGSMRTMPKKFVEKLPQLNGVLQRKGYIEEPQILFGAVGDAYSDSVPLQIGQFEIGNEMDDVLSNILLEGGGGGGNHESYELAMYYFARHTNLDIVDKHDKKGFLFIIGDERPYSKVSKDQVKRYIGDDIQSDIPTSEIVEELKEKYEVVFLFAKQGNYKAEDVIGIPGQISNDNNAVLWRELLEQNAIILEDADAICETITLTIASIMPSERFNVDDVVDALKDAGFGKDNIISAKKAIANLSSSLSTTSSGNLANVVGGDITSTDNPVDRL